MKLKSAVFLNALNVAFTQLKTKMTVSQLSKIRVKAEQGNFMLFAEFLNNLNVADGVGGTDGAVFSFFKSLTDSAALAEDAVLAFNKALSDTVGLTDPHSISFAKPLDDSPSVTDPIAKGFSRPVADSLSFADDAALLGLDKSLSETPSVGEQLEPFVFGKNPSDSSTATDAITARALTKSLANNVDATDDIDGSATTQDDQEVQFAKITTNVANVTEVIAIAMTFNRAFADSFGATDGDVLNFGKRPSDTTSMTDAGSLRSQGYCDFTYFQEDYVGASRTF